MVRRIGARNPVASSSANDAAKTLLTLSAELRCLLNGAACLSDDERRGC